MASFLDDPEQFFRTHSIVLPANPDEGGKIGQLELMRSTMKTVGSADTHSGAKLEAPVHVFRQNKQGVAVQPDVQEVSWMMGPDTRAELIVRQAPSVKGKVTTGVLKAGDFEWFPCLVLPWTENSINYMKIPRDTDAVAFFTGAMNGCTFLISGDAREPHVSHINSSSAMAALDEDYAAKIKTALALEGVDASGAKAVSRGEYKLGRPAIKSHEDRIEQGIDKKHKIKLDSTGEKIVTDTLCFVMGVKEKGAWRFFYQQVITHKYAYIKRLGKTGGWRKWIGVDNRVATDQVVYRALNPYVEIWPGSGVLAL